MSLAVNRQPQSQTLDKILLDLRHAPFSHGQAYVAISRVHLATDCSVYVNDGYCAERNGRLCAVVCRARQRGLRRASQPAERGPSCDARTC